MAETTANATALEQRNRELFILGQIAEALNREVNLDQALQTTLAQVTQLFGLQTGWVFLLDPDSQQPYLAAAQNLPPALAGNHCRLMEDTCYCLDAYAEGLLDRREKVERTPRPRVGGGAGRARGPPHQARLPLHRAG
ncbi:MAG TPA: GAF domain-containing protein, partial [Anaerolineae bacterium]|nr:GAF domain-containing protein [Anaerolineae bacterium]